MSDVDEMLKIIILQVLSAFEASAKRFVNIKSVYNFKLGILEPCAMGNGY